MPIPLQTGGPVSLELLLVFVMAGLVLLGLLGVSVWIYRDAKRRNLAHPYAWGVGSFLGGFLGGIGVVVVWVLYFVVRDDHGASGPSVREES